MELLEHCGIILDVGGKDSFDSFGASFACALIDRNGHTYLFYSGTQDVDFRKSSIGLAESKDGINFEKIGDIMGGKDGTFCAASAMTPAVFEVSGRCHMILAGHSSLGSPRTIGTATAETLNGPWMVQGSLAVPRDVWEGYDMDCGPGICKDRLLAYYSNVSEKRILSGRRGLATFDRGLRRIKSSGRRIRGKILHYNPRRKLGILELSVDEEGQITAKRYEANPLDHLNGPESSWNESLFCPGYLKIKEEHCLFPAASTYSIGPPFKQYMGFVRSKSPFFDRNSEVTMLIDGPKEKKSLLPKIIGEIALDTPSPVIRGNEVWLYYAVMDRTDNVWKTALSKFLIAR